MNGARAMQVDRIASLEDRVASLEVRNAVEEVHRVNVSDRLTAIEDTLKWLVRLIVGGLLMGVLAFVLHGGLTAQTAVICIADVSGSMCCLLPE